MLRGSVEARQDENAAPDASVKQDQFMLIRMGPLTTFNFELITTR